MSSQHSLNLIGEPCYIKSPGPSGLDKRQYTLHYTMRAHGEQLMKAVMMYRGQGNIKDAERAKLNACKNVKWCFMPKAWATAAYSFAWLKEFAKVTDSLGGWHLLLMDDLKYQHTKEMYDFALTKQIIIQRIPGGCTDLLQPVFHTHTRTHTHTQVPSCIG